MEFSRQEYRSGLPFLTVGDLPDSGIKPACPVSSALVGRFFTTEPPGVSNTETLCRCLDVQTIQTFRNSQVHNAEFSTMNDSK